MKLVKLRGITLIEMLMFVIIVTIGLIGALAAFGPAVRNSADPMLRKQTLNLAEAMLREVMNKSYQNDPNDPGNTDPTLGCTVNTVPACPKDSQTARPNYNDVDDYGGSPQYSQTGVYSVSSTSAPIAGLATCIQTVVSVTPATLVGVSGKYVTVSASCGSETITLTAFRGNYGG